MLLNISQYFQKTPVLDSIFNKVAGLQLYWKRTPAQVLYCEHWENFKNSFFSIKHFWWLPLFSLSKKFNKLRAGFPIHGNLCSDLAEWNYAVHGVTNINIMNAMEKVIFNNNTMVGSQKKITSISAITRKQGGRLKSIEQ